MKDLGPISWYVAECSEIDNFPYMIRRGDGTAVAKVMRAEDARYIVECAWKAAPCRTCGGSGYIERKVYTQEPAALVGIAAATKVTCPDCS